MTTTMSPKLSEHEQKLSECKPKRISSYGSHPWAIVHKPTGQLVQGPSQMFDFGDYRGVCQIMGPCYFARKKDAQAALDVLKQRAATPVADGATQSANE